MNKVSCEVIKDLLPLYYDSVCSKDSKKIVEEHLLECDSCKMELEKIQDEIYIPVNEFDENRTDGNVIKSLSISWKRLSLL